MKTDSTVDRVALDIVRERVARLLGWEIARMVDLVEDPETYHDLCDFKLCGRRMRAVGTDCNPNLALVQPCSLCGAFWPTAWFSNAVTLRALLAKSVEAVTCKRCQEAATPCAK